MIDVFDNVGLIGRTWRADNNVLAFGCFLETIHVHCPSKCRSSQVNNKIMYSYIVNKTNRRTEFQFYWYYDSTCFGQPFCPSSGVHSPTSALVHFMQIS